MLHKTAYQETTDIACGYRKVGGKSKRSVLWDDEMKRRYSLILLCIKRYR